MKRTSETAVPAPGPEDETPEEMQETILAYLRGEIGAAERAALEIRLTESEPLRAELERTRALLDSLTESSDASVVRLVSSMIREAIQRGASDLHVLPERKNLRVRFRVDGFLHDAMNVPLSFHQPVVDRFKALAEMNICERRLPQDGRIPISHDGKKYDLRVHILPTLYGERVTARLLNQSSVLLGLDNLGLSDEHRAALGRLARLRHGLVLACGWPDTGKSTLLYSLLLEALKPDAPRRNILTVEEPVELALGGVSQTAVDRRAGLTFPVVLGCILRSDPDLIYCGEMLDAETATLCVEAASTGTLVFSTMRVPTPLRAVERLRQMGVPDFRIADSLAGLVGPRLVRRTDARQTEEYEPAPDDLARLGLSRADGPFRCGIPTEGNGNTGFSGRIPLMEVIPITDRLRRRIAEGAPIEELAREAHSAGGSLRDDARAKVKAGLTTVEEVNWALFDYPAVG